MFKKILKPFQVQEADLQEKAFKLCIVNFMLIIIMFLGVVMNGLEGKILITALNFIFIVALVSNFYLLSHGKFSAASYTTLFVLSAAIFTMNFLDIRETPFTIWKLVSYNIAGLITCALFVNSFRQILSMSLASVALLGLAVYLKFQQNGVDRSLVFFVVLYSFVIQVASNYLIINLFQTFKRHLDSSREAHRRSQQSLLMLKDLIDSSSEGLSIGNTLVSTTSLTIKQAQEARSRLDNLVEELTSLERQVSLSNGSYEKIEISGNQVGLNMQIQTAAVNESSTSVEHSSSLIQSISQSAQDKSALLSRLVHNSADGAEQLENSLAAFREVSDTSAEIIDVITVIEDIAERTNMLAMNASIEAAHASAAGRGFAVVADEIRKLAEETNLNSRHIRSIIENNHMQIINSVKLSEGTGRMYSSIHTQIEEVDRAIAEILKGLHLLAGGTSDITSSVTHLRSTNSEVNTSLTEMHTMTGLGRDSMKAISEGSKRMLERVEILQKSIACITEYASQISVIGENNTDNMKTLQVRMQELESL